MSPLNNFFRFRFWKQKKWGNKLDFLWKKVNKKDHQAGRTCIGNYIMISGSYLLMWETAWDQSFFWCFFSDFRRVAYLPIPFGYTWRKIYYNRIVRLADNFGFRPNAYWSTASTDSPTFTSIVKTTEQIAQADYTLQASSCGKVKSQMNVCIL